MGWRDSSSVKTTGITLPEDAGSIFQHLQDSSKLPITPFSGNVASVDIRHAGKTFVKTK